MKFLRRYPQLPVLLCGGVAALLRLWMLSGGTDDRGLYPANHPGWVMACLLGVLAVVGFFLLSRQAQSHVPIYPLRALGNLAAAVGIALTALGDLATVSDKLGLICGYAGLASTLVLLLASCQQLFGKIPHFISHMLPCVYFALRSFLLGRVLGAEPELCRFLFELLAFLAMIPACYQLWGFDVDAGDAQKSTFWSMTAAFLCIAATAGSENAVLYASLAVFLLTNFPALQPQPAEAAEVTEAEVTEEEAQPESEPLPEETFAQTDPLD